jgi:tetratricopeptide (TPR) repeat protein
MTTSRKAMVSVFALLGPLALGGCESATPELRPVFGHSGLSISGSGLSAYEKASADFAAGRYGLATKHFQMAVAEAPDSIEALNGLAASYDQIGRFDLSERYYRRALAAVPNSAQTLNNLGYSLFLQGKYDVAVALLTDATRIDTANGIIASNLSMSDAALEKAESVRTVAAAAPQGAAASMARAAAPETVLLLGPGVTAWKEPRIVRMSAQVQELRADTPPPATDQALSGNGDGELMPVAFTPLAAREMSRVARVDVFARPLAALPAPTPQPVPPTPPARRAAELMILTEAEIAPPYLVSSEERISQSAVLPRGTIEASNGAGRRQMAARMRDYLKPLGLPVTWLSNADHFRHATSTITYRPGYRELAEAVALRLPITVAPQVVSEQSAAVRIELGGDLLDFDRQLLQAKRGISNDKPI